MESKRKKLLVERACSFFYSLLEKKFPFTKPLWKIFKRFKDTMKLLLSVCHVSNANQEKRGVFLSFSFSNDIFNGKFLETWMLIVRFYRFRIICLKFQLVCVGKPRLKKKKKKIVQNRYQTLLKVVQVKTQECTNCRKKFNFSIKLDRSNDEA